MKTFLEGVGFAAAIIAFMALAVGGAALIFSVSHFAPWSWPACIVWICFVLGVGYWAMEEL